MSEWLGIGYVCYYSVYVGLLSVMLDVGPWDTTTGALRYLCAAATLCVTSIYYVLCEYVSYVFHKRRQGGTLATFSCLTGPVWERVAFSNFGRRRLWGVGGMCSSVGDMVVRGGTGLGGPTSKGPRTPECCNVSAKVG